MQNNSNLVKNQLYRLSFLRKQESKLSDSPGFRIKCGMTDPKAHLIEHDFKKQSQFAGEVNWRNISNSNDLLEISAD